MKRSGWKVKTCVVLCLLAGTALNLIATEFVVRKQKQNDPELETVFIWAPSSSCT